MKIILVLIFSMLAADPVFAQDKPQPGRYQVVSGKVAVLDSMVLVDTWTGKTWKIGASGWVPMSKSDVPEQMSEAAKNAERVKKQLP